VAFWYSYNCKPVNIVARAIVHSKSLPAANLWPALKALCEQVRKYPELKRIAVFNNGIAKGSIGIIPTGGQTPPIQILGAILEWKKAQKKAKKNIVSETINSSIPKYIFCCTL